MPSSFSPLNLNIHFHMLMPDAVLLESAPDTRVRFVPVRAPGDAELQARAQTKRRLMHSSVDPTRIGSLCNTRVGRRCEDLKPS